MRQTDGDLYFIRNKPDIDKVYLWINNLQLKKKINHNMC